MTTATTSNAAAASLLGAIVGDAAAQTSHWNYDRKVFHAKLRSAQRYDTPEFFPCNSYYNVTPGGNSCYGDELIAVAEYLTTIDACCNDDDDNENDPLLRVVSTISNLVDIFEKKFNGSSIYGPWPIVNQPEKPLSGPWRHGSIKDFLTNLQKGERGVPNCGSNADSQADCFVKAIPVVCMYAGHPAMLECVEIIVRLTQNNDTAVAYAKMAARVLESCILGTAKDVQTAIQLAVSSSSSSSLSSLTVTDKGKLEEAKLAFKLVLETCHMEPPTYEMGVNYLGSHKLMKSHLNNPVSLVA